MDAGYLYPVTEDEPLDGFARVHPADEWAPVTQSLPPRAGPPRARAAPRVDLYHDPQKDYLTEYAQHDLTPHGVHFDRPPDPVAAAWTTWAPTPTLPTTSLDAPALLKRPAATLFDDGPMLFEEEEALTSRAASDLQRPTTHQAWSQYHEPTTAGLPNCWPMAFPQDVPPAVSPEPTTIELPQPKRQRRVTETEVRNLLHTVQAHVEECRSLPPGESDNIVVKQFLHTAVEFKARAERYIHKLHAAPPIAPPNPALYAAPEPPPPAAYHHYDPWSLPD